MRSDVAAANKNEAAATSSSTSSSMRRSSEQSTISSMSSFNASTKSSLTKSTRIHRHHRHGRIESTAAGHTTSIPTTSTNSSTLNSSSTSSSCETSLSRSATKKTVSSSLLSSSSSSLVSKEAAASSTAHHHREEQQQQQQQGQLELYNRQQQGYDTNQDFNGNTSWLIRSSNRNFLAHDNLLLSSPDGELGSLAKGLGSDLAELESMTTSSHMIMREQFASRLVDTRRMRLSDSNQLASGCRRLEALPPAASSSPNNGPDSLEMLMSETNSTIRDLKDNPPGLNEQLAPPISTSPLGSDRVESSPSPGPLALTNSTTNEAKIRDLMDKARRLKSGSGALFSNVEAISNNQPNESLVALGATAASSARSSLHESAAVKGKIERIDQRMNDLCRKLESCRDTQRAAELLKIMIQTIEKAWSIPVCGDDLGFNLCSSLRQSGSLDIILRFIYEADARQLLPQPGDERGQQSADNNEKQGNEFAASPQRTAQERTNSNTQQHPKAAKQLKLNLFRLQLEQNHELNHLESEQTQHPHQAESNQPDEDSDILTSDLGLDSTTSLESLSYVSAVANVNSAAAETANPDRSGGDSEQRSKELQHEEGQKQQDVDEPTAAAIQQQDEESEELRRAREEELVLLSAHLLSQCLTSENRDYIVQNGLDPVIKLACQFTTMKSKHSKRLLKRSALIRRSSKLNQQQHELSKSTSSNTTKTEGDNSEEDATTLTSIATSNTSPTTCDTSAPGPVDQLDETTQQDNKKGRQQAAGAGQEGSLQQVSAEHLERSDLHSAIGTEILQHLFKHSEETCSRMINLGALQAILYGCRSAHVETLRHCASALANLALYGGPDSQQTMIEQKAHVWLFPLAFNEDDNVQYYACLAIVVLAANQEIEADVIKSSTLDLVEPFVTSHEPRKFAESTTSHIHGQSGAWLGKLMPLLDSKREEARNLACFHFAMEAYIKREQGRTQLFKEIESIEPLRRAGSSPIAIASKFACQALRLIGEPEPHKLSQQVPLWTCEDVCVWVSQIGFERFVSAFRDSHVDGDLLLQLDEEMLKFDIGISNGIIRRRFLRELSHLKRIADYSSVDRSNLGQLLINTTSLLLPSCCSIAGNNTRSHGVPAMISGRASGPSQQQAPQTTRQSNHALHCCATTGASGAVIGSQQARSARDYLQYIYPIIQLGVTRDNIHLVDCDHLLAECKITNALHRVKLANSIRELQDRVMMEAASQERNSLIGGAEQKTLDVFVSYRRSNGSQLASLLKVHLQLRGFSVFIDVERLEAGKFDNNLLESIRLAKNFILVLSPNALDRCIGDHECKDWIHKEIVAALASGCNIIPIFDNQFHWPDGEQLPEDMRSITYFNGIRWSHDYQDASVDKIERFIRGELNNSSASQTTTTVVGGCPFTLSIGAGVGSIGSSQQGSATGQYQRFGSHSTATQAASVSTPSLISSTPSLCGPQNSQPPHFNQLASGVGSASTVAAAVVVGKHDHQSVPDSDEVAETSSKPLTINYPTGHTLEVNPNVRLR